MRIHGSITGIQYQPSLCNSLPIYDYSTFNINSTQPTFLLSYGQNNNFAVSSEIAIFSTPFKTFL